MKIFYRHFPSSSATGLPSSNTEPYLILHGLYGASDNWLSIAKQLSAHAPVFALDQRNHGQSPHSDIHTYAAMSADLKEFMDDNDIPKARLIGHSMGGKTVMHFALSFPERVASLSVLDIAPIDYNQRIDNQTAAHHSKMMDAMLALNLSQYPSRDAISKALAPSIGSVSIRMFLLKNLSRNESREFQWKINLPVLRNSLPQIMSWPTPTPQQHPSNEGAPQPPSLPAAEGVPVTQPPSSRRRPSLPATQPPSPPAPLFLRGQHSDYVQSSEPILQLFPQAQITTIPNAGHWLHAEQPRLVLQALTDYNQ